MKKTLQIHLAVAAGAVVYLLLTFFGYRCPFRTITKNPCPTCGMTRSALSLLQGDFAGFLAYNPTVILALPTLFLAVHSDTRLFSRWNPFLKKLFVAAGCTAVLAFYLIRLCSSSFPAE